MIWLKHRAMKTLCEAIAGVAAETAEALKARNHNYSYIFDWQASDGKRKSGSDAPAEDKFAENQSGGV